MAQDYKGHKEPKGRGKPQRRPRSRRRAVRQQQAPGWVWLGAGLAIGLAVALGVYLQDRVTESHPPPESAAPERGAAPEPETAAPAPGLPPEPRFDFYTILPEMEVVIPQQEIPAPFESDTGATEVEEPGVYVLQVGSFRREDQADSMRANLALLGIETNIQTVTTDEGETWHRVRVGPYRDLDELNAIRARLREHDIDALLVQVRG